MKKIISVCLCICLISGCDKSLSHGRPANTAVEDKGSEGVPTQSLTSNTSALAPSNTPAPTPEPSKSAPSSDSADTGISVGKYVGYSVVVILSVIVVCCGVYYGGYKPLYRFADIKPFLEDLLDEIPSAKNMPEGCKECYFSEGHFFDWDTDEFIEEIPVSIKEEIPKSSLPTYYYKPNSLMLNLLKTLLRKIFRIEVPKSYYDR
ncbi:hypothetical protein [Candidatus Endomicrobiellum agilis]|uniref:hypothetical protein n=1 Tax=Candidatus Endomicrobiellum agilis TaxID=3238957 RepID=UPI00357D053D|nr:hypothetical protein [Endomicrobium sp.]